MALQTNLELEAVLTRVILKVEKYVAERGSWPALEDVHRTLQQARAVTRQSPKLKAMRQKLGSAGETLIAQLPDDSAVQDDIWDIEDFIDYRA